MLAISLYLFLRVRMCVCAYPLPPPLFVRILPPPLFLREQKLEVVLRQPPERAVVLPDRRFKDGQLFFLEPKQPFLHTALDYVPDHLHAAELAQAVQAVHRLVLRRRVPPEVEDVLFYYFF